MPDQGSKRVSAGGLVGGATAVATAIAAVIGVLNQLGYVGSHEESKAPVIIMATPVAVSSPLPVAAPPSPLAQASKAAAPAAQANATPVHHKHVAHKPKPPPVEEAASNDEPAEKPSVIARATPAVEAAATIAAAPAPAAAPPPPPEAPAASSPLAMIERPEHGLTGAWVDESIGACHLINQSGNSFNVTNYDPSTGEVMSYGDGTIDGNHISIIFRGHRVMADFHISQSHNTLYGKITRPTGIFRSLWRYIGPACQKPAG
jgi:hypothetical protein